MIKEEKIREVWISIIGEENFNSILRNEELRNDGWRRVKSIPMFTEDIYDVLKYSNISFSIRPKLLKGIEDNNGWIKLESEDDLPKEKENYLVRYENGYVTVIVFDKTKKMKDFWIKYHTHYQPIIKPKEPLY